MKKRILFLTIVALIAVVSYSIVYDSIVKKDDKLVRDDIIRLHILANSDSPEDQDLKLDVRDKLLKYFGQTFRTVEDLEAANELINANMEVYESIALDEIYDQGYKYSVRAEIGTFSFPTKVYGETVYPAGDYKALRVVIGEGKGANWWCVMFPPLCFVDVSSNVVRETKKNEIDEISDKVLDDKESDDKEDPNQKDYLRNNTDSDKDEDVKVVYTFKLAEYWNSFKNWIKRIF